MIKFALFIVAALVCLATCETEFFNLPDLAFIPDGVYDVFPGAPNKNGKFDTIQGAIDQALCDGFTPDRIPFQVAVLRIYTSEVPYRGDPVNNEIRVPASVILSGTPFSGSAIIEPQIEATVIFTNENVPIGALTNFQADFKLSYSSIQFIQPSSNKSAVHVINDPNFQPFFYVFNMFEITNRFIDSTVEMIRVSGGASTIGFFRGFMWTFSAEQPCIRSFDATEVFVVWSNLLSHKFIEYEDAGSVKPRSNLALYYNDFFIGPIFFPPVDTEVRQIKMKGQTVSQLIVFGNIFVTADGIEDYTTGTVIYDGTEEPAPGIPFVNFMSNTYDLRFMAGGRQLLYDAPNSTVRSGNFVTGDGIKDLIVGTLISSVIR